MILENKREGMMPIKEDTRLINKIKMENKLNIKDNKFLQIMNIYTLAMKSVKDKVGSINKDYNEIYKEDLINHIMCRIKTPDSIMKKMKRKNYELTYKSLIENINDIAGVRIICPFKSSVFEVVDIIKEIEDFRILKEKDYITNPKKTGYSSYHMIIEVPVQFEDSTIYAKVEIQIRTLAMDFWATLEHELKYKSDHKITDKLSRELVMYAKIINRIDHKMAKIHDKKLKKKIELLD